LPRESTDSTTGKVLKFDPGRTARPIVPDSVADPEEARLLIKIGDNLILQGRLKDAEDRFRRSLKIREKVLGEEHPEVADALDHLGKLLDRSDRMREAEACFVRAVRIREQHLREDASEVSRLAFAESTIQLGLIRFLSENSAAAEGPLRKGLEIRVAHLGRDHVTVGQSLYDLGCLLAQIEQLEESVACLREALQIFDGKLPNDEPRVTDCKCALADALYQSGVYEEAESLFGEVLILFETMLPPDDVEVLMVLEGLEDIYEAQLKKLRDES